MRTETKEEFKEYIQMLQDIISDMQKLSARNNDFILEPLDNALQATFEMEKELENL